MNETDAGKHFRKGDTVHWGQAQYNMYVTGVDGNKVTTDAWADIPAHELVMVKPVEDKYEAFLEAVGAALKDRQR